MYKSVINDAKYSRLESEHDQIKSELMLNPGYTLYKDRSKSYRMILSGDYNIKDMAKKYFDYIPESLDKYSLDRGELIAETIQL